MCEEVTGSVTGTIGELLGNINMWIGIPVGIATAITLMFVLENIVWIGLGIAVLTITALYFQTRRAVREIRTAPQSALWTADKARTLPDSRRALPAPRRRALPVPRRRALPAPRRAIAAPRRDIPAVIIPKAYIQK